jgi:hypothetical protein
MSGRAWAKNKRLINRPLALAVVFGFFAVASAGLAYAQPNDGDGNLDQCQASAGPPGTDDAGQNPGNCGEVPSPPVVIGPGDALFPILCNAGAVCIPG